MSLKANEQIIYLYREYVVRLIMSHQMMKQSNNSFRSFHHFKGNELKT